MSETETPRQRAVALLNTLGDPDDAVALAAARELDRLRQEHAADWDMVLPANLWSDDEAETETETDDQPVDTDDLVAPALIDRDLELIRHLRTLDIEPDTEDELDYIEQEIRRDRYVRMDRAYVHELARRMGVPIPEV